jgi:hypothetical protein
MESNSLTIPSSLFQKGVQYQNCDFLCIRFEILTDKDDGMWISLIYAKGHSNLPHPQLFQPLRRHIRQHPYH